MMASRGSIHVGLDEEGMRDPVVLRGLVQCIAIGSFFALRYVLDVLLTPHAVEAIPYQVMTLTQHAWVAVWCMPVLPIVLLYCWSSLERGMFSLLARYVLRFWILRSLVAKLMDDQIIIGNLRKVHIWVPLQWFVTFTRISSGREKPSGEWRGGIRWVLCHTIPWIVRYSVFSATWSTLRIIQRCDNDPVIPSALHAGVQDQGCFSFTGVPVPCEELERVRRFNREIMPTMGDSGYRAVRRTMNGHRFPGHVWHVGHACPDPSKEYTSNDEDFGWNLFAQHAVDNLKLGHCLVSCAEAEHMGADHVRCTHSDRCVTTCDTVSLWQSSSATTHP